MFGYINKFLLKAVVLLLLCLSGNQLIAGQTEPYQTIMDRVNTELQQHGNEEILNTKVLKSIAELQQDGSWADINYANPDYDPLGRIKMIAIACSGSNHKLYGDAAAYAAVVKSLQYWLDKDPKNKNWWYNEIFYPKTIGEILILMRYAKTPLPQALEVSLLIRMTRKLKTGDGANTSDEALHYLYRACLTARKTTLDSAAKYLYEPVSITDGKEGLQVDNSYFQHGKQQAIASYGAVFAENSVNAAFYLRGTDYAMPAAQLQLLITYVKDTFFKTIRGTYFDFNVKGRGISRKDSLKGSGIGILAKVEILSPENDSYWQAAMKRIMQTEPPASGVIAGHKQYWKSGYTLHTRPGYTFSVQAASSRTLRTERGNNENILGKFLADGATNIQIRGDEYLNIMPVWEWDKIPGVTSRIYGDDEGATIKQDWGIPGTTSFVGGVSNGLYGVSVYAQDYDQVQAKKAWFFFDKEIVCLGAGIKSEAQEEVRTTVNQNWLKGNVIMATAAKSPEVKTDLLVANTEREIAAPSWIWHDHIAYFFPEGGNLSVSNQAQKGSWYRINQSQPKEEVSGEVFQLSLSHGIKPANGTYEYVVVPGLADANAMKNYNLSMIHIISNTADLQVVEHKGLDILQLVFYKGGVLKTADLTVKADKACTILIQGLHTANPIIDISDPALESAAIALELKLPGFSGLKKLSCVLPEGAHRGATIRSHLN
ncbi:chondroitinase [Pedobacter sp. PAMC26386]|nr:chondroitinase [Pedobacter sp. PAMC26386]